MGGLKKLSNEQTVNLNDFFDTTLDDLEEKIKITVPDDKIKEILKGGKRLRSLLAQLTFKASTEGKETLDDYHRSLEGSVSIELAHGASLVHDDIIDKDSERRGKKAFHIKEGIGNAILTGHKMLAMGFDIALKHGKRVAKLYVDSWNEVVNGEINEVDFNQSKDKRKDMTPTKTAIFEAYSQIIDMKTASLFASACESGALEADMAGDILKVFSEYGREIGIAYQLADDLVDLAEGEMIDSVIIPLLNRIDKKVIKNTPFKKWELKRKVAKNEDKIKEFYLEEIKKHVKKAEQLSSSEIIPESHYKKLLNEAPTYIINRMLNSIDLKI